MPAITDFHVCPATGCEKKIRRELLMCSAHWARVPFHLQQKVRNAWRALLRTPASNARVAMTDYKCLRDLAIKSASPAASASPDKKSSIVNHQSSIPAAL